MKIKRISGSKGNPITFFSPKVEGRMVKLMAGETQEVPDDVGYEMLIKYEGQIVKIEEAPKPKNSRRKNKLLSVDTLENKQEKIIKAEDYQEK